MKYSLNTVNYNNNNSINNKIESNDSLSFGKRIWERIDTSGDGYSPRTGHTVVSYGNSLYVFGGTDKRRRQQDLFQYDINTCIWTRVYAGGPLPPRRSGAHGIVYKSNFYIFGGYDGRDGNYYNDLYYFSFDTRKWYRKLSNTILTTSTTGSINNEYEQCPEARTDHIMVLYKSFIYIFGGYDGRCKFDSLYEYSINHNKWRKIIPNSNKPSRRFGHAGAVHEETDTLYIFGGWDGKDTLNDLYSYSFINNKWEYIETKGNIPPHRYRHSIVIHNNNLFLFGGVNKAHSRFNDLYRLDLNTFTWSEVITTGYIPSSRTFHRAVVAFNRMYLLGGYDGTDRLHDLYSILIGPLVPDTLLKLCLDYTRNNLHQILKHNNFFNNIPQDIISRIWGRDTNNVLRGKCLICRDGLCAFYELSRTIKDKYILTKSIPKYYNISTSTTTNNNNNNNNNDIDNITEYKSIPCTCGHTNVEHEYISDTKIHRPNKRLLLAPSSQLLNMTD